ATTCRREPFVTPPETCSASIITDRAEDPISPPDPESETQLSSGTASRLPSGRTPCSRHTTGRLAMKTRQGALPCHSQGTMLTPAREAPAHRVPGVEQAHRRPARDGAASRDC